MKPRLAKKTPRILLFESLPHKSQMRSLIPEDESRHLISVLRLQDGDLIEGLDGKGNHALLKLQMEAKKAFAIWVENLPPASNQTPQVFPVEIHLGIPKGEAMEWICEKATELGIRAIHPWVSSHCVVDALAKGPEKFQQRWQTIADQAMKQCGRLERLTVHSPKRLSPSTAPQKKDGQIGFFLDEIETLAESRDRDLLKLLTNSPLHAINAGQPIQLWIGPEGGWSDEERGFLPRNLGVQKASLGHLVLRSETAALVAMSLTTACLRNAR